MDKIKQILYGYVNLDFIVLMLIVVGAHILKMNQALTQLLH
jgi:hypothetical protein